MNIGKLAKLAGVGVDTVRFYERGGLLPKPRRGASGYRTYDVEDVDRLRFIRRAKALGFSLEEIAELLMLSSVGGDRAAVKAIASRRVADLDQKIEELTRIRDTLARHARRCSAHGPVKGCPIIDVLVGR